MIEDFRCIGIVRRLWRSVRRVRGGNRKKRQGEGESCEGLQTQLIRRLVRSFGVPSKIRNFRLTLLLLNLDRKSGAVPSRRRSDLVCVFVLELFE